MEQSIKEQLICSKRKLLVFHDTVDALECLFTNDSLIINVNPAIYYYHLDVMKKEEENFSRLKKLYLDSLGESELKKGNKLELESKMEKEYLKEYNFD